jgi:hypothetical protein
MCDGVGETTDELSLSCGLTLDCFLLHLSFLFTLNVLPLRKGIMLVIGRL